MTFKCKIGIHSWYGCICFDCGKIRDKQHDWGDDCEKCSECGKIFDNQHNWSIDCEKCSRCGKTRKNQHERVGGTCSKCGLNLAVNLLPRTIVPVSGKYYCVECERLASNSDANVSNESYMRMTSASQWSLAAKVNMLKTNMDYKEGEYFEYCDKHSVSKTRWSLR